MNGFHHEANFFFYHATFFFFFFKILVVFPQTWHCTEALLRGNSSVFLSASVSIGSSICFSYPHACPVKGVNYHAGYFLLVYQQSNGEGPPGIQHWRPRHLWLWNISGKTSLNNWRQRRVMLFTWLERNNSRQWKKKVIVAHFCLFEFFMYLY